MGQFIGEATGYRHRVRLAVRGRVRSPKVGIFAAGTHQIVDIPHCNIHHPLINQVASALKQSMARVHAPPYSDTAGAGLVRYLQVVVEPRSQTAQVTVVANSESIDPVVPLLTSLHESLGDRAHSVWFNGNTARTNAILGPMWQRWAGAEYVEDYVGDTRVFYPPGAFGQSHPALARRLVSAVHAEVPAAGRVVELYCGVGAIGLGLADRSRDLILNELGPDALRGLAAGIDALPKDRRSRVSIVAGDAETAARHLREDDVVIVDPPRRGLTHAVLEGLLATPIRRLVYVSCDVGSFERDARSLLGSSRFSLVRLDAFEFFPFTTHVETFAVFDRRS